MMLTKLSTETLTKASILTHKQMSKIFGGWCSVRCNGLHSGGSPIVVRAGDIEQTQDVPDCERATVLRYCGSVENAICGGTTCGQ